MWERHTVTLSAEEGLERLSLDGYQWLEEDDRRSALARLLLQAGRDPEQVDKTLRSDVETVTEADFRTEIGAPARREG